MDDDTELIQENNPSTNATASSRLTSSSVGTIPEFPLPGANQAPPIPVPPRRSANIGPPPSGRRGASSFFSSSSYVSPIPEESSRSHGSYASSAAMPGTWVSASPATSPYHGDAFYDDSVTEKSRESIGDEFGDESKLVRSASIGKKGKAALVDNKPQAVSNKTSRPSPKPVQLPFHEGTGYQDKSTSSSDAMQLDKIVPAAAARTEEMNALGPRVIPEAAAPGENDPHLPTQTLPSARMATSKRPPKLDIDAVRAAEARGSITSLPDLIKRATRLAAMIEKGKRPASGLGNFNDLLAAGAQDTDNDGSSNERYQSGLSDMLAAFPPPGQPTPNGRRSRGSWFRTTSWPLIPNKQRASNSRGLDSNDANAPYSGNEKTRSARKCCGMPPWAFVLVMILILCAIAAAIVVPLQFFVFKSWGNHEQAQSSFGQCQASLDCQNGGVNVFSKGVCSCICTNGFTGNDCSSRGSDGCTTTKLVSPDSTSNIDDVTLGKAIPRLISDASSNFSIPLSGTVILAKINNGDLSCRAQNSLVTFRGRAARSGENKSEIVDDASELDQAASFAADQATVGEPTATLDAKATMTLPTGRRRDEERIMKEGSPSTTVSSQDPSSTGSSQGGTKNFKITEEVLDFARVAVLYVLQEETSSGAEAAQSGIESFFSRLVQDDSSSGSTNELDARNLTIGGDNTINLVDFQINLGEGNVGGKKTKRDGINILSTDKVYTGHLARFGGSVLRWAE